MAVSLDLKNLSPKMTALLVLVAFGVVGYFYYFFFLQNAIKGSIRHSLKHSVKFFPGEWF